MRRDMAKLLVERPRIGGKGKVRRYRTKSHGEDSPTRESMSRAMPGRGKQLNENLAPLVRFLRSSVGRLWDEVHAEIRERVRADSVVQLHILEHLWDFVERDVVLIDGVPHSSTRRGYPLTNRRRGQFYVHPITRRLMAVSTGPSRKRREKPKPTPTLPDGRQLRLVAGVWYAVEIRPITATEVTFRDAVLGEVDRNAQALYETYGMWGVCGGRKSQLGKREIRRLGLR